MSKYIDKDEAIRRFGELHGEENALLNCYNADWIESFLECQPEANVVEVVRCKDCKWWQKLSDSCQGKCFIVGHYALYPTGSWYCANGERKE